MKGLKDFDLTAKARTWLCVSYMLPVSAEEVPRRGLGFKEKGLGFKGESSGLKVEGYGHERRRSVGFHCRAKIEQLGRPKGLLPDSQGQNLALNV